jgi:hypothetical protein
METKQMWVVFLEHKDYEGATTIVGIAQDLKAFKELARVKFGITSEPIENIYGRGSLHYEYSVEKYGKFSEYYHLVAEPAKVVGD